MVKEAPTYTFERIVEVISNISNIEDRVYAELLFWLACREGELAPYVHYKHKYTKGHDGEPPRLKDKKQLSCSFGLNVDNIELGDEYITITNIPVFKTKNLSESKNGFVFKKGNPFFNDIYKYVAGRKAIRERQKELGDVTAVYLFDVVPGGVKSIQQDFWARRKRLERHLKKADKDFRIHSLRRSRATIAGDASGDVFYVRDLTGHKTVEMASRYVSKRRLFDSMKKYEVKE